MRNIDGNWEVSADGEGLYSDDFPEIVSNELKYGPAMETTSQLEADAMFDKLVRHSMAHGLDFKKAITLERYNLGYYAGYYSDEIRRRVEKLFKCEHPFFGSIEKNGVPTPEEAFKTGFALADKWKWCNANK